MAEPALGALYEAMNLRLRTSGDLWSDRVYADTVPEKVTRPYVIYFWTGGGESNRLLRTQDAELVLTVKGIANNQGLAFAMAGRLSELLNDKGRYDDEADQMNGGADWWILTTTQEGHIHLVEMIDGDWVYHEGFQLRVKMERK